VKGQHNFDTVPYEYFREREIGFVAFTSKNYCSRGIHVSCLGHTP